MSDNDEKTEKECAFLYGVYELLVTTVFVLLPHGRHQALCQDFIE